jgi:ATP-dependent Lon protease
MKPKRIPLFPLELVLFPGIELPLHIFESRYRAMTRYCMENRSEFGVVFTDPKRVAAIGCTAEILKIAKTYPDGRMDLLTEGRSRVNILDVFEEKLYVEGMVEYLPDEPEAPSPSDDAALRALFDRCHTLVYGRPLPLPELPPGHSLAYRMTAELPLALDFKQEMLELRSESERRARLREQLSQWAPQLEAAHRLRKRATGNGHRGADLS